MSEIVDTKMALGLERLSQIGPDPDGVYRLELRWSWSDQVRAGVDTGEFVRLLVPAIRQALRTGLIRKATAIGPDPVSRECRILLER